MTIQQALDQRVRSLAPAMLCSALVAACASPVAPGQYEQRIVGSGQPVVVFQSGVGDGLAPWAAVQDSLADKATSIAFSRPGYGRTPATEGDHSACAAAAMQREVLRQAGLKPPYVLVGHSLGGLYQYAFARMYPEEVAAVVLLDPTHPHHWDQLQREALATAMLIRAARLSPAFTSAMRREFDDQQLCLDDIAAKPMPPVPVRVLVRGRFVPSESGAFERIVRDQWTDWPRLVGVRSVESVPGAGHYIQRDQPRAVVEAIVSLSAARAQ